MYPRPRRLTSTNLAGRKRKVFLLTLCIIVTYYTNLGTWLGTLKDDHDCKTSPVTGRVWASVRGWASVFATV